MIGAVVGVTVYAAVLLLGMATGLTEGNFWAVWGAALCLGIAAGFGASAVSHER